LWFCLLLLGKPYAREVQGAIGEGSLIQFGGKHPPFWLKQAARISDWLARLQLRKAYSASYVSHYVRGLYPTCQPTREFVFSSVHLSDGLVTGPRSVEAFSGGVLRMISVGRLEAEKGHDVGLG
jgi:hypothetical protein